MAAALGHGEPSCGGAPRYTVLVDVIGRRPPPPERRPLLAHGAGRCGSGAITSTSFVTLGRGLPARRAARSEVAPKELYPKAWTEVVLAAADLVCWSKLPTSLTSRSSRTARSRLSATTLHMGSPHLPFPASGLPPPRAHLGSAKVLTLAYFARLRVAFSRRLARLLR